MFSKIFAFYDLSVPSRKALQCALQIAEKELSELTVIHVLSPQAYSPQDWQLQRESLTRLIRQQVEAELHHLKAGRKFPGMHSLHVEIIEGKPVKMLLSLITNKTPDLVVVGTHGRTGWSHIRLGSVAEQIVRLSASPVLICRGGFSWPPRRMLLPVDVKEPVDEALLMANALSAEEDGKMELFNVFTLTQYTIGATDSLIAPVDETPIREKITQQLQDLTLQYPGSKFDMAIGEGHVASEICKHAEKTAADLVIIPSHGRTGINHFFMGSIAEQVIRYATCSVLSFCPKKLAPEQREMIQNALRHEEKNIFEENELGVGD